MKDGENGCIDASEDQDVGATVKEYLSGEEAGSLSVSALFLKDGSSVTYMSWEKGESWFYLQVTPKENGPAYYKLYSPRRGSTYENWDNERAQKSEVHRRWFAWLRDGMWKEGE